MHKRRALWLLGLVLLTAFALRLCRLDFQDIWWDEARNIDVAGRALSAIATSPELDIHPPLYFYLLHGWMWLVGESPFAVRLLSTAFGLLTVPMLYQLGRDIGGQLAGVLAALVAALAPFALGEAQETRMYTMAFAWLCLAGWCLWRALAAEGAGEQRSRGARETRGQGDREVTLPPAFLISPSPMHPHIPIPLHRWRGDWGAWVGFALFSALSLLTHYSTLFVLVAFAVFVGLRWLAAPAARRSGLLLRAVISGLAIGLLCLPQAATAWRQIPGYRNPNLTVPGWREYLARCWQAYNLGLNIAPERARLGLWGIGALLAAGLLLALWHSWQPRRNREAIGHERRATSDTREARGDEPGWGWAFLFLWLLLPLGLYYWVLLDRATFDPRYISFVAPAYWLLLGGALAAFWRQARLLGLLATVLLLAALVPGLHSDLSDPAYFGEDTSGLVAWLKETTGPDDLVLVDQRYPLGFHYPRWNNDFDGFPPAEPADLAPAQYLFVDINTLDRRLTALAAGKRRVFWVQWYKSDTDPRGAVDFLLRKFGMVLGEQGFRGYQVRWYAIAPDTTFELAPALQPMNLAFGDQVELVGWAYGGRGPGETSTVAKTRAAVVPAGQSAWAVLRWRQLPSAVGPLKVSLRLLGEDGRLVGQNDRVLLNDRHLSLPHWNAQDQPLNVYLVEVGPDSPPGLYLWQVVVYEPGTLAPLSWLDAEGQLRGEPAALGWIRVLDRDGFSS